MKKTKKQVKSCSESEKFNQSVVEIQPERHVRGLFDDPGLLQQVLRDLGADDRPGGCELHLQVLAKAAGVVVYSRAGVSEGLHQRVDLQDFLTQRAIVGLQTTKNTLRFKKKKKRSADVFKASQSTSVRLHLSQEGQMLNNQMGALRLPRAALPADYDALKPPEK